MSQSSQSQFNELGQPIGVSMTNWQGAQPPQTVRLEGNHCFLEPLSEKHFASFAEANALDKEGKNWTYLPVGPFTDRQDLYQHLGQQESSVDPLHFAICLPNSEAIGSLALMRQNPSQGVIEVGWVTYTPALQQTVASTEAQYLLMRYVFEQLGYRRYEWKCDSLNVPSRRAAERLGFTFEGIFRQAAVYKGRSRDTAWYSIIDSEWPMRKETFDAWLAPENFDENGRQRKPLASFRSQLEAKA